MRKEGERRKNRVVNTLKKFYSSQQHTFFTNVDLTQETLIPFLSHSPNPKQGANNKEVFIRWKTTFFRFVAEAFSWDNCFFDSRLINRIKISFLIFFAFQDSLLRSPLRGFFHASRASEKQDHQTPPNSTYRAPRISSSSVAVSINGTHHT